MTNANGTVTDTYDYDPWGNLEDRTGSTEQPYQYVGQLGYYTHYQDDNMQDLLQLGVRFYEPGVGRFGQRDPLRDGVNHYLYVADQPTKYLDPTGLISMRDMDCKQLTDGINKEYGNVKRRWYDLREDRHRLSDRIVVCCADPDLMFAMAKTRKGAEDQYKGHQRRLVDLLQEYNTKGCHQKGYKVPADVWKVATAPVPEPELGMQCVPLPWPSFPVPVPAPSPGPILQPQPVPG